MPTHLAIGINSQGGQASFLAETQRNISFVQVFENIPKITLTFGSVLNTPPYRINLSKTGFTIKTQIPFTGIIEWTATDN